MEVEVIIFPVNGKWNDYTGVSKEMREQTYRNIEEIAKKYTNVKVLNYGNREYDDYFLFDVMHVGVKGWMQVERELYEFAKQNYDNSKLFLWTIFFYILIMGIIIYCFMTDFSNVQEYVYSEF